MMRIAFGKKYEIIISFSIGGVGKKVFIMNKVGSSR